MASIKDIISKYARNEDDALFLAKLDDKLQQAGRGQLVSSNFLDPHQRSLANKLLTGSSITYLFDGGYDGAERAVCLFVPEYLNTSDRTTASFRKALIQSRQYPIRLLRVQHDESKYVNTLTHRDYLGALMNLGIRRETLGDILVHRSFAQIMVLDKMADYIINNLIQVSNAAVRVQESDILTIEAVNPEVKIVKATVASLRLDAVLAEGFSLSRGDAASYIKAGKVALNFEECLSPDARVAEGCIISLRGMGRMVLEEVGGQSKKNRMFITIKRFV